MLRRSPLFTAVSPQLVSSGLVPDVQDSVKPLWQTGIGVQFVNGKVVRKREPKLLLRGPSASICGIGQQRLSNSQQVLWFVAGTEVWRWDKFSYAEILDVISLDAQRGPFVDFLFYGNWTFINTGIGTITRHSETGLDTFPEMPSNVAVLLKHLSFLMALGTGNRGVAISWSDANAVDKWVPAAANSAGDLFFEELEDRIVAGAPIGDDIACYSANQLAVATFIGDPFYFGKRKLLSGIGAVGKKAVTSVANLNYGVSRNGCWMTDGSQYQYIDEGKLNRYFQDKVDWERAAQIVVSRNELLRTIEFFFPLRDDTFEGWGYDPQFGTWSKILHYPMQDHRTIFGNVIAGDTLGNLWLKDRAEFNTQPMSLRTKPMLMQLQSENGITDVHIQSKVDEIELLLHSAQNVDVRIGSSMDAKTEPKWSAWLPVLPEKQTYNVPAGVPDGVYWTLEFRSTNELTPVIELDELLREEGDPVVIDSETSIWELDLQGFMLFGVIRGSKS